mgnify:CR=1 FL=1
MYDNETDVLTRDGWKSVSTVTTDDELAVLEHDRLNYRRPLSTSKRFFSGNMISVLSGQAINLMITPDHPIYAGPKWYWVGTQGNYRKVSRPLRLYEANECIGMVLRFKKNALWNGIEKDTFELPGYSYRTALCAGKWQHRQVAARVIRMDDWLNFLGWYCSEGYTTGDGGMIRIAYNYNSQEEKALILAAITSAGFNCTINAKYFLIKGAGHQLGSWLSSHCGVRSSQKKVPKFIFGLSPRQIRIFLNSLFLGDATKGKTGHVLASVSKTLIDEVQELILKAGDVGRMYRPRPGGISQRAHGNYPIHQVNWTKDSHERQSPKEAAKLTPYSGDVFGVNMPNGIIYIRRGGIPAWCGC